MHEKSALKKHFPFFVPHLVEPVVDDVGRGVSHLVYLDGALLHVLVAGADGAEDEAGQLAGGALERHGHEGQLGAVRDEALRYIVML